MGAICSLKVTAAVAQNVLAVKTAPKVRRSFMSSFLFVTLGG
jgi:hypothetical protein